MNEVHQIRGVCSQARARLADGAIAAVYTRGIVGSETGPSYYTFDLRARYIRELPTGQLEFFVDVLNVLNKQLAISQMALVNGNGTYAFGEDNAWVEPRRAYLGVRYSF